MPQPVRDEETLRKLGAVRNPQPVTDPTILRKLEDKQPRTEGFFRDIGGASTLTGLADVLGAPTDIVNAGLSALGLEEYHQIGGSDDLRELGSKMGLTLAPGESVNGLIERINREIGATVLPVGGFLATGGRVAATSGSQLAQAARAAAQRPGLTSVLEFGSATTSAMGGELANKTLPGNEAAEIVGELGGGFAPSIIGAVPRIAVIPRAVAKATFPFTEYGGRLRAARRLQSASPDTEQAAADIERFSTSGMTPAQASGQKQLLEIENAVRKYDPQADRRISESLSNAENRLREKAATIPGGRKERIREILENRRDYLLDTLDVRSGQASADFARRVSELGPEATPRELSAAANSTIRKAYEQARNTERELWGAIKTDIPTDMSETRQRLANILRSRSEASDPADIPGFVRTLINRKNPSVRFVQDLRSRIGQEIRKEQALDAPNRRKISILTDLSDSLLEDMSKVGGQSESIDSALAYSRDLNQKFRQGKVGNILGFDRTGAGRVDPQDTIQYILGGGTPTTNVQEVYRAAPGSREQIEDFLRNTFAATVIKDGGGVDRKAGRRFLNKKYADILDLSPNLRDEFEQVVKRGERAETWANRREKVKKVMERPQKTVTSLWLNSPVDKEMDALLRAKNPVKVAAKLRRQMQGNDEALNGLKQAYLDSLFRKSLAGSPDEEGVRFIQGGKFREMLNETRGASKALGFSESELKRLETVSTALSRASTRAGTASEIVGDRPSKIIDIMGSVIGAKIGGKIGDTSGSSLQAAGRFSKEVREFLGKLTRDKATEIVRDAVEDPELYKSLLLGPTEPIKKQRMAVQRLNAYIGTTQTHSEEQE